MHRLGVAEQIQTSRLFEVDESVLYRPFPDDPFPEQPIWSSSLFHTLHEAWSRFRPEYDSDVEWLQAMAQFEREALAKDKQKAKFSVIPISPTYQLRAYLFCLFRGYESIWRDACGDRLAGWTWFSLLAQILSRCDITAISFNYDCVLETVVAGLGYSLDSPLFSPSDKNPRRVLVLKPHGSISYQSAPGFVLPPTKWQSETMIVGCRTSPFALHRYPPDRFPTVPDLVPPGFSGEHLMYPGSIVQERAAEEMARADVVVWCGLSAREPDTDEVTGYLRGLRSRTAVIHVGLPGDERNPAGQLLQRRSANYTFCNGERHAPYGTR